MKDLEFTQNEKVEFYYDICAGIMAVAAVLIVMMEFSDVFSKKTMYIINCADNIVYLIFLSDIIVRFIFSKDKFKFIKHNVIDLIAIFPFNIFSNSQYISILKLIRVFTYLMRLIGNVKEILFTNGFIYALGLVLIVTIVGSIGIYIFEYEINPGIKSYDDALWWSIVTVTTVGYGDIVIITKAGRIVASVLMVTGVAFLGMLTSTMSTFFFAKLRKKSERDMTLIHKNDLLDISQLSEKNRLHMINYYNYLLNEDKIEKKRGDNKDKN